MSLFGDLPSAKNDAPGSSFFHKRTLVPPPSILRNKRSRADGHAAGASASTKAEPATTSQGLFAAFGPIEDEYDPAVPNEYGKAKEDQERAVLDAEMEARKAAEEREAVRSRALWLCTMHHCAPFENSVKFALPAQGRGSDTARAPWQAERT